MSKADCTTSRGRVCKPDMLGEDVSDDSVVVGVGSPAGRMCAALDTIFYFRGLPSSRDRPQHSPLHLSAVALPHLALLFSLSAGGDCILSSQGQVYATTKRYCNQKMRTHHALHTLQQFPVYSAAFVADNVLALGGGGGSSRSGIKNKLVFTLRFAHFYKRPWFTNTKKNRDFTK